MPQMSMNKVIHGAFRRDVNRFIDALDRFPASNRTRAAQLAKAWENFDDQLTYHHTGEHEIAWPHLRAVGVSDELLATMDAEHDDMALALAKARSAMGSLATTASAEDAQSAKAAMQELKTVMFAHLEHEEAELEPVYLSKQDTEEIKAMGKEFSKVSPARGGRFFAWIMDGASEEEKTVVTGNVPPPVLAVISGIFGRGYRKNVAPVWRS
ncbi:MAG TPA: hemerythrin domain-containing protein [Actinomycetes bacterium]|nr:hemerythrin domain-containing protein [Actinomycetes bacterium]